MWPCYEYLLQSPLLPTIPPCIIMSSDMPPRRSSRLSNKRTVVPDDGTDSVAMTVTKRRGKRTDAGRRHTMTYTFVFDVLRILYDTVSLRHNIWKNRVQYMHGVVCSAVMRWPWLKYMLGTTCKLCRAGLPGDTQSRHSRHLLSTCGCTCIHHLTKFSYSRYVLLYGMFCMWFHRPGPAARCTRHPVCQHVEYIHNTFECR